MKALVKNRGIVQKLVLIFLLSSFLTAGLLVWMMSSSFDTGLLNYVNKHEQSRVKQLSGALEQYYTEEMTWDALRHNGLAWRDVGDPVWFGILPSRIQLLDSDMTWVAGQGQSTSQAKNYPLMVSGKVVGTLTVEPAEFLTGEFELEFQQSQQQRLGFMALFLFVISAVLAWAVARSFLLPIKDVIAGTNQLRSGKYGIQLFSPRHDELGKLVDGFNGLSSTLEGSKLPRDRWVADIAHELRTPLSILQGEIMALLDGTRDVTESVLASLYEEVKSLTRLVNDLYLLSLSDSGGLHYRFELCIVDDVLANVVESLQVRAEEQGCALTYDGCDAAGILVKADRERLIQLLNNLLVNSLWYTDKPGVITATLSVMGGRVVMTVNDSAPAVSEVDMMHLFDRLYRVEKSRNSQSGGAGLGLSICQNIVKAHHGDIQVYPSDLGGLKTVVSLPLASGG